jgi:type IV fimbrial biogenesis protein FimT
MKRQRGFNLTELVIVVAIVAILLGVGVPSYRYITNSYRMSSEVNGLLGDLMYARAESIKEGQGVTVCISKDGVNCLANAAWQNGWVVFSNPNGDANPPNPNAILRLQAPFTGPGGVADTFIAGSGISAVTYNREGFATTAAGFPATTITLHDQTANAVWTRCLLISAQGTLTTETPANSPSGTCL